MSKKIQDYLHLPAHDRLAICGHRAFVGGDDPEMWYGIGRLQFDMLVERGLEPHHAFLDVACGALRLGQFLIPYLQKGRYTGLDVSRALIDAGLERELSPGIVASKCPSFIVTGNFDVTGCAPFDMAIAQSLFTHLTLSDIRLCASQLRHVAKPESVFYFTYFEGDSAANPEGASDPNACWYYPFDDLADCFDATGWRTERIGDWNHPRRQMLAAARPL